MIWLKNIWNIHKIKKTLGIDRIHTEYYSWRSRESMPAAQIDLIIDRAENLTNVCEIKYSHLPFSLFFAVLTKKLGWNASVWIIIANFVAQILINLFYIQWQTT